MDNSHPQMFLKYNFRTVKESFPAIAQAFPEMPGVPPIA
jgi:hypothetical protein